MFEDVVRGEVGFEHDHVDDFVILRSDRTPTYHLASTVDDVDYEITHVVRGEDLLASTPKHILLTLAVGAEPGPTGHDRVRPDPRCPPDADIGPDHGVGTDGDVVCDRNGVVHDGGRVNSGHRSITVAIISASAARSPSTVAMPFIRQVTPRN